MIADQTLIQFYTRLTGRQRQVLQLVSDGLNNREIAALLFIEPCVVASHLTNIYEELGTLEALADRRPNRYLLIRAFAGFFQRHPYLNSLDARH
jgi:DNA-binding NarL/FixJ family response regulator